MRRAPTCPDCGNDLVCSWCDADEVDPHDRRAWEDAVVAAELKEATGRGDR